LTLGSLFDGIGGFPLAAARNGINPIWASEIEAAPISITKRHFPCMKHLGDIKKISGAEIEAVDIITFGSPCQDLSVAGKRAGIEGERSGLFIEAIRVIKEMREKTHGEYPTRIIWENVLGAFSSNRGEDFRIVLEEIAKIADPMVSIPRPPAREEDDKFIWDNAGGIMGDGWSLAWRVMDAQYWGVPQRRKRIFLIADFRSQRAGEILFKREGLPGNNAESGKEREGTTGNAKGSVRKTIPINTQIAMRHNALGERTGLGIGKEGDPAFTLQENHSHAVAVYPEVVGSLIARADGSPCVDRGQPFIFDARGNGDGKTANTITGDHENRITDYTALAIDCRNHTTNKEISNTLQTKPNGGQSLNYINPIAVHQNQSGEVRAGRVANTLNTNGNATSRNAPLIAIGIDSEMNSIEEKMGTIRAHESGGAELFVAVMQGFGDYKETQVASSVKSRDYKDSTDLVSSNYSVRRLTPLECERLMGFPDGWTEYGHDNKKISDSARYKALGNSVAIPCVEFIFTRIQEDL